MIGVLALGVPALHPRALPGAEAPLSLTARDLPADDAALVELLDRTADLLDTGHPVVALHTYRDEAAARSLISLLRRALGTVRIASVATALPPLGASLVAYRIAALAAHDRVHAGTVHSALPALEADLLVGAWLGGPPRGPAPVPSPRQRVGSVLGLRGYVARAQPAGRVQLAGADPALLLASSGVAPAAVLLSGDDPMPRWVRRHVVAGLDGVPLVRVPGSAAARRWWGCRRVVEVVAVRRGSDAPSVPEHRTDPGAAPAVGCGWCGLPAAAVVCPFCGHTGTGRRPSHRILALAGNGPSGHSDADQ